MDLSKTAFFHFGKILQFHATILHAWFKAQFDLGTIISLTILMSASFVKRGSIAVSQKVWQELL